MLLTDLDQSQHILNPNYSPLLFLIFENLLVNPFGHPPSLNQYLISMIYIFISMNPVHLKITIQRFYLTQVLSIQVAGFWVYYRLNIKHIISPSINSLSRPWPMTYPWSVLVLHQLSILRGVSNSSRFLIEDSEFSITRFLLLSSFSQILKS